MPWPYTHRTAVASQMTMPSPVRLGLRIATSARRGRATMLVVTSKTKALSLMAQALTLSVEALSRRSGPALTSAFGSSLVAPHLGTLQVDLRTLRPGESRWPNFKAAAILTATFKTSKLYVQRINRPNARVTDVEPQQVFDTTFCGDWAGAVWSSSPTCSGLASTCQDYVQNNPSAFANAYWLINSLQVYQSDGATAAVNHVSSNINMAKNNTLPLLTTPLAMGGGLPKRRRRYQSAWTCLLLGRRLW